MSCQFSNLWPAGKHPVIRRGVSWPLVIKPRDLDGTPFDFAGLDSEAEFRDGDESGDVLFTLTGTYPEAGQVRFELTNAQTATLELGQRVYFQIRTTRDDPAFVWEWVRGTATVQ